MWLRPLWSSFNHKTVNNCDATATAACQTAAPLCRPLPTLTLSLCVEGKDNILSPNHMDDLSYDGSGDEYMVGRVNSNDDYDSMSDDELD